MTTRMMERGQETTVFQEPSILKVAQAVKVAEEIITARAVPTKVSTPIRQDGILTRLLKQLFAVEVWLSGGPKTERERTRTKIANDQRFKWYCYYS
ncbi:MAG: hypothetical protein ACE5Q6_05425 [Dehalococcoidia bacterium]